MTLKATLDLEKSLYLRQ